MFKVHSLKLYFAAAAVILLAACAVSAAFARPVPKASCREDYPELLPMGSAFGCYVDFTFEEYVNCADLILDATVKGELPGKAVVDMPEECSGEQKLQEKWGLGDYVFTHRYVELEVNDVWIGSVDSTCVVLRIPERSYGPVPIFQPGSRMILFLEPDSTEEPSYLLTTANGSLYYVSDDQKVYPTFVSKNLTDYSGKKLYRFKQDVRKAWDPQQHEPEA